jgi:glycosyltransferase 2 family protein
MRKSNYHWSRMLPGFLITLLSLGIIIYLVNPKQFIEALKLADYRFVALVFMTSLLWLFVRSLVWRTLLKEKASLSQVFLTINEGYLLNNILPFRLGEVGRAFLLGKKANLPFLNVFSTIIIERALDIAFAAGLLLSSLSFVVGASWAREAALSAGMLVLIGLITLYIMARYNKWVTQQINRFSGHWSLLDKIIAGFIPSFLSGLEILTDGRRFFKAVSLMILNWFVASLQFYLILAAFFPNAKYIWGIFALSVSSLGIAAPSSPGAVGVFELSMVTALALFGLDTSISLAAAITAHLSNYIITGIIGVFALFRDGLSLAGVYQEVRELSHRRENDHH